MAIHVLYLGGYYNADAYLDMRMSKEGPSAADLVNSLSVQELTDILRNYGEEKFAPVIARKIVASRENAPIKTTLELAAIIKAAIPVAAARKEPQHPAKRTFQAIRIEVNGELDGLYETVLTMTRSLKKGGRIVIITFHSLEDRIVKKKFKEVSEGKHWNRYMPVVSNDEDIEFTLNKKK